MTKYLVIGENANPSRPRAHSDANRTEPTVDEDSPLFRSIDERETSPIPMAKDLLAELDATTLDQIDGEFYWRHVMWIRSALIGLHRTVDPLANFLHSGWDTYELFRYLNRKLSIAWSLLEIVGTTYELFPDHVFAALFVGDRVSMRPPVIVDAAEDLSHLELRVISGTATGAQVTQALRAAFADGWHAGYATASVVQVTDHTALVVPRDSWPWLETEEAESTSRSEPAGIQHPPEQDQINDRLPVTQVQVTISAEFELVSEYDAQWDRVSTFLRPPLPYVRIRLAKPYPPPDFVGHQFDLIVRQHHRWHEQLHHHSGRQELPVAIRTWTVGLLQHQGVHFRDAMRQVCEATGLPEVSQSKYQVDKQRLIERVPEARHHLEYRSRGTP